MEHIYVGMEIYNSFWGDHRDENYATPLHAAFSQVNFLMAHGRDESESNLWYGALGHSVPHKGREQDGQT